MPDLQPPKPSEDAIALWRQRRAAKAQKQSKPNLKQLAATLKKNADDNITRLEGTLLRTAGAGGNCLVRLTKPWKGLKELPATAIDGCTAHKRVVLFRGRDGDWFALGKGNERLWYQQEQARKGRYSVKSGSIQYVLQKPEGSNLVLYVCGSSPACVKTAELPAGTSIIDLSLDNLGEGSFWLSICYKPISGPYVFRLYDQVGLVREFSELGLNPFIASTENLGPTPSQLYGGGVGDQTYGNGFFYSVGYGQFIGNYLRDAGSSSNPVPVGGGSGSVSGTLRALIDLKEKPEAIIRKDRHPTHGFSINLDSDGSISYSGSWSTSVFSTTKKTVSSTFFLSERSIGGAPSAQNNAYESRYVFRVSEDGTMGVGETFTEKNIISAGGAISGTANLSAYVASPSVDKLTPVFSGSLGVTDNRFLISLSSAFLNNKNFFGIQGDQVYAIEYEAANKTAKPPIPEETLYNIQRSTDVKLVTVQVFSFDFSIVGSIPVSVFPPDVNQGDAVNAGIVVAASYAPNQS